MWIPLHVHSQYSILDAAADIQDIVKKALDWKMPAVALTDHGNMFGAVDFYKACKDAKIKPILGCEFYVAPESRFDKKKEYGSKTNFHLTVLAKNDVGYHNLCKLSSLGFTEGFYYYPRIDHEILERYSEGLICLSGCISSLISFEALQGTRESLLDKIRWYQDLFGDDYYLELQRHRMSEADMRNDGLLQETWLQQYYQNISKSKIRLMKHTRKVIQ